MGVIREFHDAMGGIDPAVRGDGRLVRGRRGDGLVQRPVPDPRAGRSSRGDGDRDARRDGERGPPTWRHRGHHLDFTVGISLGYATIGTIGFEGRFEYGAVGSVLNLASRLCDEAGPGQILMSARAYAAAEHLVEGDKIPDLKLKGFAKPVMAFSVRRLKPAGRALVAAAEAASATPSNRADAAMRPPDIGPTAAWDGGYWTPQRALGVSTRREPPTGITCVVIQAAWVEPSFRARMGSNGDSM